MPPRTAGKRKISYAESEEDDEGSDFAKGPSSEDDSGGDDDDASIDSVPKKSPKKQSPAKSDKKSKVENKKSPGKSSIAANKEAPKTVKSAEQHASISTFTAALGSAALGNVPPLSAVVDITQGPPVTTDTAAKKLIQQYMKQQNRPYSALQIHDNLHKRIPKATVERVLTNLSNPGEGLLCKEYGKMKIYFVDQSTLTTDFTEEQLDQLKGDNDDLKDQIEQLLLQEKEKRSNLAKLSTEPTDDDLDRVLEDLEGKVSDKQNKVILLTSGAGANADPKALQNAVKKHNFYRKAWFERRSLCMDAVDLLCEGLGKKKSELLNDLCLETDEDVGQVMPALIKESR